MTVDEYIAAADPDRRPTLERLRALIREVVPGAHEEIRYGMPCYDHHGGLVAFAAQKRYFSVYIMGELLAPHRAALGKLDCGKGCIRFRSIDQLPEGTLREILVASARANEDRAAAPA